MAPTFSKTVSPASASTHRDFRQTVTFNGEMHDGFFGGRDNLNIGHLDFYAPSQDDGRGFWELFRHIAANAMHDSEEVTDQPKCHPETREAIMKLLLEWASELEPHFPFEWVNGPAGAGKSTILRTLALLLLERGLLLGSFFFFRSSERRNNSKHVISTLAYQLATQIPQAKLHIAAAVERNPNVFNLSLRDQALILIVSPLVSVFYDPSFDPSRYPRILVIDGLDECSDTAKQCQLLGTLLFIVRSVPLSLSVIIASRPEHHIRNTFDSEGLKPCSHRLSLDGSFNPDEDIRRYLRASFEVERRSRLDWPRDKAWPPPETIDILVAKASGQFIYASTAIKFISSPRHNPAERLSIVLGAIKAGSQNPFEQLDLLYGAIFGGIDSDNLKSALRILGYLLIPNLQLPYRRRWIGFDGPIRSPNYIENFLALGRGDVRRFLYDLESLLTIGKENETIQLSHASLSDYLFDSSRSGRFWIGCDGVYNDILKCCLSHMRSHPEFGSVIVNYSDTFCRTVKPDDERLRSLIQGLDIQNSWNDTMYALWLGNGKAMAFYPLCFCSAIVRLAEIVLPYENLCQTLEQFRPIWEPLLYQLLQDVAGRSERIHELAWYVFYRVHSKEQELFCWFLKYLAENLRDVHFSYEAEFTDMASSMLENIWSLAAFAKSDLSISCFYFLLSRSHFDLKLLQQCRSFYMLYELHMSSGYIYHSDDENRMFLNLAPALVAYISRAKEMPWPERNNAGQAVSG